MGDTGFEPVTSSMSTRRASQLRQWPIYPSALADGSTSIARRLDRRQCSTGLSVRSRLSCPFMPSPRSSQAAPPGISCRQQPRFSKNMPLTAAQNRAAARLVESQIGLLLDPAQEGSGLVYVFLNQSMFPNRTISS